MEYGLIAQYSGEYSYLAPYQKMLKILILGLVEFVDGRMTCGDLQNANKMGISRRKFFKKLASFLIPD